MVINGTPLVINFQQLLVHSIIYKIFCYILNNLFLRAGEFSFSSRLPPQLFAMLAQQQTRKSTIPAAISIYCHGSQSPIHMYKKFPATSSMVHNIKTIDQINAIFLIGSMTGNPILTNPVANVNKYNALLNS